MKETSNSFDFKKLFFLSIGALGVVYGDIGTSPLYAVNEIFFGHASSQLIAKQNIIGAISLILWSLILSISIKYVILVLKADNEGEGGVFALYGLLEKYKKHTPKAVGALLLFAAGLLLGDGIITPAISVTSAVEGLSIAQEFFHPYIVPITVAILILLFSIQSYGTSKVGLLFGPIVTVWFIVITLIGAKYILLYTTILSSFNPAYALNFLISHDLKTNMLVMGSVMLVITGGEAMYADLGHFGILPIRITWFSIVFPALLINYMGQGAYLLNGFKVYNNNLFFSMVPSWGLYPMILLSTAATVIASQALISGAFSLATQAISLNVFPYLRVMHTNKEHSGQIYVSFVNWILCIGSVLLVLTFRSSNQLASAYGLAVSGVMLITTIAMYYLAINEWKLNKFIALFIFLPFVFFDSAFLFSNLTKIFDGGYIPLLIGFFILLITKTWKWGYDQIEKAIARYPAINVSELIKLKDDQNYFLPQTIVILSNYLITDKNQNIPALKQIFLERYGTLPLHLIFLKVSIGKDPHTKDKRYEIYKFYEDDKKGSIVSVHLLFGFMDDPDVEKALGNLAKNHLVHIEQDHNKWLIHTIKDRAIQDKFKNIVDRIRFGLFRYIQRNTDSPDNYFRLGKDIPLSIEVFPIKLQ